MKKLGTEWKAIYEAFFSLVYKFQVRIPTAPKWLRFTELQLWWSG